MKLKRKHAYMGGVAFLVIIFAVIIVVALINKPTLQMKTQTQDTNLAQQNPGSNSIEEENAGASESTEVEAESEPVDTNNYKNINHNVSLNIIEGWKYIECFEKYNLTFDDGVTRRVESLNLKIVQNELDTQCGYNGIKTENARIQMFFSPSTIDYNFNTRDTYKHKTFSYRQVAIGNKILDRKEYTYTNWDTSGSVEEDTRVISYDYYDDVNKIGKSISYIQFPGQEDLSADFEKIASSWKF